MKGLISSSQSAALVAASGAEGPPIPKASRISDPQTYMGPFPSLYGPI